MPARPIHSPTHPGRPDPHHVPRHPTVRVPPTCTRDPTSHPQPSDNIRFDLLRTGSVELTSNKILERGFLEPVRPAPSLFFHFGRGLNAEQPPPAYFTLYPRPDGPTDPQRRPTTTHPNTTAAPSSATTTARHPSLIERYHLAQQVTEEPGTPDAHADAGGKAKWEDTPEKREASLRERKAQMVLAARQ